MGKGEHKDINRWCGPWEGRSIKKRWITSIPEQSGKEDDCEEKGKDHILSFSSKRWQQDPMQKKQRQEEVRVKWKRVWKLKAKKIIKDSQNPKYLKELSWRSCVRKLSEFLDLTKNKRKNNYLLKEWLWSLYFYQKLPQWEPGPEEKQEGDEQIRVKREQSRIWWQHQLWDRRRGRWIQSGRKQIKHRRRKWEGKWSRVRDYRTDSPGKQNDTFMGKGW